ncbi:MAG: TolC family protein [Ignavibacteria bacterium]|nr:TolC family protein [Ignavibacteria bacterium]
MMLSTRLLAAVFMIANTVVAIAGSRPISLEEAIEIGLKQNKNIIVSRLNVERAKSQIRDAYGSAMPSLNVNASVNRLIQSPVFFFPNPATGKVSPLEIPVNTTYTMTAQVQQILFNGAVMTAVSSSELYLDAANAQLDAAVAEVVTETKKKYYQAAAAAAYYRVAVSALENVKKTQQTVASLFSEGFVSEFDKIRADVAVANVEPLVVESESGRYAAQAALQTYLALDLTDTLILSIDKLPSIGAVPDVESALQLAISANYDLRALDLQIQVASKMVNIQESDYYPTIAAYGQWQHQGQRDNFANWLSAPTSLVGLNFSMNIFNGLKTQAKVEQSKIDVATIVERRAQLLDILELQTRTVLNQLAAAKARIGAQASTVSQAQRGYEISQVRYTEGEGRLIEISDAETALSRAKVNEISARLDYHTTLAEYERVTGQIDERYRQLAR